MIGVGLQVELGASVLGGFLITYIAIKMELKRTIAHYRAQYESELNQNLTALKVVEQELERRRQEYEALKAAYESLKLAELPTVRSVVKKGGR